MGNHQIHIHDNNKQLKVTFPVDNCNSFEVREDKEPGYVYIESVSSQRDWVQRSQVETNDTEANGSEIGNEHLLEATTSFRTLQSNVNNCHIPEIDGNIHTEEGSNDTETDDSQTEEQQSLEATTNCRTSKSSDNMIPEIGNEQLLEATTSFKTSQSNGNNIPEMDVFTEGGSNDTETDDSQTEDQQLPETTSTSRTSQSNDNKIPEIDHLTMHSPPPFGADIGMPNFSCIYPLQDLTATNAVKLLEDCKFQISKNWEMLTRRLKVPKDERTKQRKKIVIDSDYTGALEELLDVWILNGDHPTWQKLISAVHFYEKRTAKCMRKMLGMISEECRVRLQRRCDDNLLTELGFRIPDFTAVAPFFITTADIEDIEKTSSLCNGDKIREMLWKWRERNGRHATYHSLICIFHEMEKDDVACFIQENVEEPANIVLEEMDFPIKMNETELHQLEDYNMKIRKKFSSIVVKARESLLKRNIDPSHLKFYLLGIVGICKEIDRAKNLDDIFLALYKLQSYFDFGLYEAIIEEFGGEEEKEGLENYKNELSAYLKQSLIEIPNPIQQYDSKKQTMFVLKVPDYEEGPANLSGCDVQKIKRDLAHRLQIHSHSLSFCEYRLGCIELVFSTQMPLFDYSKSETLYIIWDQTKEEYKFSTDPDSILVPCTHDRDEKLFQQNSDESQSLTTSTGSKTDPDASLSYSFGNVEQ